jgi:hypothetical protein
MVELGSAKAHTIATGELVFIDADNATGGMRPGNNGVADMLGFSCLNGLPRGTNLVYAGQARNMASDEPGHGNSDIITVQSAGMITVVNNGPDEFKPGDYVRWQVRPWMLTEGIAGSGKPGEPCVQIEGEPLDKIMPTLGVYNELDLTALQARLRAKISSLVLRNMMPITTHADYDLDAPKFVEALWRVVQTVTHQLEQYWNEKRYPDLSMPIQVWAKWVLMQCLVTAVVNHQLHIAKLGAAELDSAIEAALNSGGRPEPLAHLKSVREQIKRVECSTYVATKLRDWIRRQMKEEQAAFFTPKLPVTLSHDRAVVESHADCLAGFTFTATDDEKAATALKENFYTKAAMFVAGRVDIMSQEQARWIRRNVIGRCTMGGAPGKQIDILTGIILSG